MLADRLRARRLVDADRADVAVGLLEHIAADPPPMVGHLLVADPGRPLGRLGELLARPPAAPPEDDVRVHRFDLLFDRLRLAVRSHYGGAPAPDPSRSSASR